MQLPKIQRERESTAELVTRELMRHLSQSDKITAGERLPSERELAEAFGVGRAAVREALRSLSLLGLVDIRPGAGTYLVPTHEELVPRLFELGLLLGEKSVTEIVETRALIEIAVAGLAATRRDQSQLDQLRDILEEMSSVVGDPNAFADLDIAFHLLLAESARNRTLVGLLSSLQGLLRVWIVRVKTTHYDEDFVKPHTDVFEAVKAGDARRAEAMMRAHMDEAWRRLESTLPAD